MVDQNPQLEEKELEEDLAPSPPKVRRLNSDASVLIVEHDLGLCCQIWDYPLDEQDQARRIYIMHGPFQFMKDKYPYSSPKSHRRCFQTHWFKEFPWLEYSLTKDAAFCFPCYLFSKNPSEKAGSDVFTVKGFNSWKKVKRKNCAFISHMEKDSNSAHSYNVTCYNNLKNQPSGQLKRTVVKRSTEEVKRNMLRL
jgi:hypothetical protein